MVFSCSSVKIGSIWSSPYSFIYKEYTIQGLFFRGRSCPEDIGNMRIFPAFFVFLRIDKTDIYRIIFGCLSSNAPWGFRDNPSHSQCISLSVTFWSSSGVSGQQKQSLSSLFIKIQNPDPSHIQSDIPLGNIFCIQADDFFKVCDVASAADLPHSGDSRLDGDSGTVVQLILFQLIGEDRAGSC